MLRKERRFLLGILAVIVVIGVGGTYFVTKNLEGAAWTGAIGAGLLVSFAALGKGLTS
jgi:uncharacterized protein (UPF0333 family)